MPKKAYCATALDETDDKKKDLERQVEDTKIALAKAKEEKASLAEDIAAVSEGIKALDQSVVEATAMRKEENADYQELMANNGISKQVLEFAMNRLNKFYNPKMYKAPVKQEVSEGDAIHSGMGGDSPTAMPGGIAGTGIGASFVQLEAVEAYSKKTEESSGVLQMIRLLITDLDKEMAQADVVEKDGQGDYEKFMSSSGEKRAIDSKLVEEKEGSLADVDGQISDLKGTKRSGKKELMATHEFISTLHSDCDWLLKYFDVRKQARAEEVDSLNNAKAILNGADYSLIQVVRSTRRVFLGA